MPAWDSTTEFTLLQAYVKQSKMTVFVRGKERIQKENRAIGFGSIYQVSLDCNGTNGWKGELIGIKIEQQIFCFQGSSFLPKAEFNSKSCCTTHHDLSYILSYCVHYPIKDINIIEFCTRRIEILSLSSHPRKNLGKSCRKSEMIFGNIIFIQVLTLNCIQLRKMNVIPLVSKPYVNEVTLNKQNIYQKWHQFSQK